MLANKRALLRLLRAAKSFKAEVSWSKVERDWDEYFAQFASDEWQRAFIPVLQGIVEAQGESINTAFGMKFDVRNLFSEAYLRDTDFGYWFENYVGTFSEPVLDTTKKDLRDLLLQAQKNGWTIEQMREQLDLNWDKYLDPKFTLEGRGLTEEEQAWFEKRKPRYRKDLIARDQTMRASNTGGYYLYRAWGAPMKEWLATGDIRTRDTHLAAWQMYSEGGNPGPIPMEMPFKVGGFSMMYPGDPSGPPQESIQCRCTSLPFYPEFAGTEEEVASARAGLEAEIGRREAEREKRKGKTEAQKTREQILELAKFAEEQLGALEEEKNKVQQAIDSQWEHVRELERQKFSQESIMAAFNEIPRLNDKLSNIYNKINSANAYQRAKMLGILRVEIPSLVKTKQVTRFGARRREGVEAGIGIFRQLVGTGTLDDAIVEIRGCGRRRPYHSNGDIWLSTGARERATIHELGHALEYHDPEVHRKALEFLRERTAGEEARWLGDEYDRRERTRKDKFLSPYMGKDYGERATEIVSMGIEYMYAETTKLAKEDPEYFDFMYNLLRGR